MTDETAISVSDLEEDEQLRKAYERGFQAGRESRSHEVTEAYDDGHRDGYDYGYENAERDLAPPRAPSEFAEPFGSEDE